MDERYKAMFIGIAIFVGGMITVLILKKFFNETSLSAPSYQNVTLKPIKDKSINILSDIRDELKVEKPVGNLTDMRESITDQITELYEQNDGFPWTSCSVMNDGPGSVYVVANEWRQPMAPIPPRESLDIDLKSRGAIKKLYLVCPPGETATVRIYALK